MMDMILIWNVTLQILTHLGSKHYIQRTKLMKFAFGCLLKLLSCLANGLMIFIKIQIMFETQSKYDFWNFLYLINLINIGLSMNKFPATKGWISLKYESGWNEGSDRNNLTDSCMNYHLSLSSLIHSC